MRQQDVPSDTECLLCDEVNVLQTSSKESTDVTGDSDNDVSIITLHLQELYKRLTI
jgi:hypothetical protein